MDKLKSLDLFSGIGGISLALEPWATAVAYCEKDKFCQQVLLSRMINYGLDKAPIWDDVTTLTKQELDREGITDIDIITGGFPCQDIALQGPGTGLAGKRSGLFFEIVRLIGEIKPRFVFLENVAKIPERGLNRVCWELSNLGYDSRWIIIPASSAKAPHQRQRWFLLSHNSSFGCNISVSNREIRQIYCNVKEDYSENYKIWGEWKSLPSSVCTVPPREDSREQFNSGYRSLSKNTWETEPDILRVAYGIPNQLDRIKSLGNSVVPHQARKAFEILIGLSSQYP